MRRGDSLTVTAQIKKNPTVASAMNGGCQPSDHQHGAWQCQPAHDAPVHGDHHQTAISGAASRPFTTALQ
jgi:hypothetical protein